MGTPMTTTDLLEPLPDLNTGPRRTTTSAIRRVKCVGRLAPWASFKQEAMQTFENTAWAPNPLAIRLPNTPLLGDLAQEHVRCGSENGLKGRFQERVGQTLGAIFDANGIDLHFGDSECATAPRATRRQRPDIIVMAGNGTRHVVGELKTFWIAAHDLSLRVQQFESGMQDELRDIIGQVARYMEVFNVRYGFLSNYCQTLFLRQVQVGGVRGLEYSPVIFHRDLYDGNGQVTLRQAFVHMAMLSLADPRPAEGGLRIAWTVRT